ncbi:MAG: hypothetical protein FLDDKLPJ_03323 [Phycisphaerae bacterium]|nr:hypothetical protein [Phycisphaerae bacterium]
MCPRECNGPDAGSVRVVTGQLRGHIPPAFRQAHVYANPRAGAYIVRTAPGG